MVPFGHDFRLKLAACEVKSFPTCTCPWPFRKAAAFRLHCEMRNKPPRQRRLRAAGSPWLRQGYRANWLPSASGRRRRTAVRTAPPFNSVRSTRARDWKWSRVPRASAERCARHPPQVTTGVCPNPSSAPHPAAIAPDGAAPHSAECPQRPHQDPRGLPSEGFPTQMLGKPPSAAASCIRKPSPGRHLGRCSVVQGIMVALVVMVFDADRDLASQVAGPVVNFLDSTRRIVVWFQVR